jgi:hypothetical protein
MPGLGKTIDYNAQPGVFASQEDRGGRLMELDVCDTPQVGREAKRLEVEVRIPVGSILEVDPFPR